MSFIEQIGDGENPQIRIYRCNFCKEKFTEMVPHLILDGDVHIHMECTRKMAEEWLGGHCDFYGLMWLKEMETKYYSKLKKVRSCYINKKIRDDVLRKYKFTCVTCGTKEKLTIDHIHPVSLGGSNEFNNLQVLCKTCNSRKSNKV